MLRFITGRADKNKRDYIIEEIREMAERTDDRSLIYLVPEQFTLQTERDLLTDTEMKGLLNIEVLSFQRLGYKIFNEVGGLKNTEIGDLGKLMVLRGLFHQYQEDLKLYKQVSTGEGFLRNFNYLLTEFKSNNVSPYDIEGKIDSQTGDGLLQSKLHDISVIYRHYEEYLRDQYDDQEDKYNILIDKIPHSSYLINSEIWIDGFTGFTGQEYRIIEELLLMAGSVSVVLTLDDNQKNSRNLFQPARETKEELSIIARARGIKIRNINVEERSKKSKEIRHIEREFYAFPFTTYKGEVGDVSIFAAGDRYSEVENVAINIISLVRERDYRWRDIAVVTGDLNLYNLHITRVFKEYDIPYFLDEKREIIDNPIVRCILSALEIVEKNFRYQEVFKYLKTGFSDLEREEYELLENFILEYGITGNSWWQDFKIQTDDYELKKINNYRQKFVSPFKLLFEELNGAETILDKTRALFNFLESIEMKEKIGEWIEELKLKKQFGYVNENTQIWNVIMDVFNQLVDIMGEEQIKLKEYRQILETGFGEYELGIIPPTLDQVLVGNLERSRSHDIKALFIIGVNDGVLPATIEEKGILQDEEKLLLKSEGISFTSDSINRVYEERFNIYSALVRPEEYLRLSYALANQEGKSLRPSLLVKRMDRLFPGLQIESDIRDKSELDYISRPLPTFKFLVDNLRNYVNGDKINNIWWDTYGWYYQKSGWEGPLHKVLAGLFHQNQVNGIEESKARCLFKTPLKTSISRIEKYSQCSFAHFIEFGLQPRPRKEFELDMLDIGRLFHATIEMFSRELQDRGLNWSNLEDSQVEKIMDEVIEENVLDFANDIFMTSFRNRYLISKLKRIGKRAAWALTEQLRRDNFTPSFYELQFSKTGGVAPLEIELPASNGEKIILEGRIDRADLLEENGEVYVRIIDYKTGKKSFSLPESYHGLQIQLIMYLAAVLENGERLVGQKVRPGGVFYFKIDDPLIELDKAAEDDIDSVILKKLKLDGMLLGDPELIKSFDNRLTEGGFSDIIPVRLNKDGSISEYFSSTLKEKDWQALIDHIKNLIARAGTEILTGNTRIDPVKLKKDRTACDYCEYKTICQFDTRFVDNDYCNLEQIRKRKILKEIRKRGEGDGPVD